MPGRLNPIMIVKLGLLGFSLLLYLISLVSDVYYQVTPGTSVHGFECLIIGWLSFFYDWSLLVPWISNILYLACIIMAFFRITNFIAIPISVIAICMTIPSFFVSTLMYNEAGMTTAVIIKFGLYFWVASYVVLFMSTLIPTAWKKQINPIPETQPDIHSIP